MSSCNKALRGESWGGLVFHADRHVLENVAGEAEIFHIYLDAVSKRSGANADVEGGLRLDGRRKVVAIECGARRQSGRSLPSPDACQVGSRHGNMATLAPHDHKYSISPTNTSYPPFTTDIKKI